MAEGGQDTAARLQQQAANFLGDLLGCHKVSQSTLNYITSEIPKLMDLYLNTIQEKVTPMLMRKNGYLTVADVWSSIDKFRDQSLFEGVGTVKSLSSYFQEHSAADPVELKKVVLNFKCVVRDGVPKYVPSMFGYIIPFLAQLQQLLNIQDVLECVRNPQPSSDDYLCSPMDGLFYKYHPLVKQHGTSVLAVSIYFDDVEPCDALKSKVGRHSLRLFYWILLNIYAEKRSTLKAINLIGIVKTKVAKKFGNEPFLRDFITAMKKLGTEGVVFKVNGEEARYFALLNFVQGDIPALQEIGGFKLTCSAFRPCRFCMVLGSNLCSYFKEDSSLLRKAEDHQVQLSEVMGAPRLREVCYLSVGDDGHETEEAVQQLLDHKVPSINYGITNVSPLSELPGFDVTKCLVQDIMHTLAEGVLENVCRLILKDVCCPPQEKGKKRKPVSLPLERVNEILNEADLGIWNKNKPSPITQAHVYSNKLKQSAAQLIVLAYILPCILLTHVSDEKLNLLCLGLKITTLSMGFKFQKMNYDDFGKLVEEFGSNFKRIYPDINTLKLHHLVHLLMQIRLFGPLRQHACFRFESMHAQFTSLVPVIRNMKNIPFSLGSRYLLRRNAEIMKAMETGKFLCDGDIMKSSQVLDLSTLSEKELILEIFPELPANTQVSKPTSVTKYGNRWKKSVVFYLDDNEFGMIESLFIIRGELVFIYKLLKTRFVEKINVHELLSCNKQLNIGCYKDLSHPFPIVKIILQFPEGFKSLLVLSSFTSGA